MTEAQVGRGSGETGPGHGCLTAVQWGSHLPPPGVSPLDVCSPAEAEICCPALHELKVICNKNVMQHFFCHAGFYYSRVAFCPHLHLIRSASESKSISAPTKTPCRNCGDTINQVRLVTMSFDSDPGLSFAPFPWAHSLILVLSTFML